MAVEHGLSLIFLFAKRARSVEIDVCTGSKSFILSAMAVQKPQEEEESDDEVANMADAVALHAGLDSPGFCRRAVSGLGEEDN